MLVAKTKTLLDEEPFTSPQEEKERIFLPEIREITRWHYTHSPEFRKLCDNRNFNPSSNFVLTDLPYTPVSLFKEFDLRSVSQDQIIKTLYSSSTTGNPSKIMLDQVTADNQAKALNKILVDFLGKERRHFLVFDTEGTVKSSKGELSSRGTAIRGMFTLAKKVTFLLDERLDLNIEKLKSAVSALSSQEKLCYFGFTWLLYQTYLTHKENEEMRGLFRAVSNEDKLVLHIGGWKKLKDAAVEKEQFTRELEEWFALPRGNVIDFYGMTEQLGTVYPDCSEGHKHAPLYSEILIRDIDTLEPVSDDKIGFIQLISPLPRSYPGISVLSEDIGRVLGRDNCPCGRKGKYFVFEKRFEKAELKGCGDTLSV